MVQIISLATASIAAFGLVGSAVAHAGGHAPEDLARRGIHWNANKRSLADCANTLKGRSLRENSVVRRSELADKLRSKRGFSDRPLIKGRDFAVDSNKTHLSSMHVTPDSSDASIFGSNYTCLLTPEVTQGPYFVTGEYVRQNVTENQEGVELHLDMQFIDVNTCEPLAGNYIDIWHANATGVYSGVVVDGNGSGTEDETNLDKTFLRGLWKTDDEGVVQFQTIFPGHYQGRAIHTHLVAHSGGYVNSNGTFSGGNVTHVGQLFYDETLRSAVEEVYPYNTNTQTIVSNLDDMWAPQQAEDDYDPYPEYVYLGESVDDGIFAWISIGVDNTASYTPDVAASLTANGGVANSGSVLGGNSTNSTTSPSGSGVAPSGTASA